MSHGWVASDCIRSALDLFAYERESDSALVQAAGLTRLNGKAVSWQGAGLRIRRLPAEVVVGK